jgi:hypothetical protein
MTGSEARREPVDSRPHGRSLRVDLVRYGRTRRPLQAEILVLRHRLNVIRRKAPKRAVFGNIDRAVYRALSLLPKAQTL